MKGLIFRSGYDNEGMSTYPEHYSQDTQFIWLKHKRKTIANDGISTLFLRTTKTVLYCARIAFLKSMYITSLANLTISNTHIVNMVRQLADLLLEINGQQ